MTVPSNTQHARRTGNVVSDLAAIALAVIAVIGLWDDRPWITFVCALVLIVALVSRGWNRIALNDVHYRTVPSSTRLVQGDSFDLTLQVENRKPVPLPWLHVREVVPPGLKMAALSFAETPRTFTGGTEINQTVGLGGYERANLKTELIAAQRGHYAFGPPRLRSGDIFGFYTTERTLDRSPASIVVYPQPARLPPLSLPVIRTMGEVSVSPSLSEDMTRPNGVREYRSGDSIRHVDWKTTAKRGAPYIRTFDRSISHNVVIVVDCATNVSGHWGIDVALLEDIISVAAATADQCRRRKFRLGFVCNGTPMGGETPPVLLPSSQRDRYLEIMHCLAAATAITTRRIETLIDRHGDGAIPAGATILHIAGTLRHETLQFLELRVRQGHPVQILDVGGHPLPRATALDVLPLRDYLDEPKRNGREHAAGAGT